MAYIKLPIDYLDAIEPLGDAERGRLFTALLEYAGTGEAPQLSGNERFLFPIMRAQIDKEHAAAAQVSEARRAAGKKGGRPKKATIPETSSAPSEKQKNQLLSQKSSESGSPPPLVPPSLFPPDPPNPNPPISPLPVTPQDPPEDGETDGFGDELATAFSDWLAYKREKRQSYRPTGLKSLTAQVRNYAQLYGEPAVAALIRECMAANWQGIVWDKLGQTAHSKTAGKQTACSDYGTKETSDRLKRDLDVLERLANSG